MAKLIKASKKERKNFVDDSDSQQACTSLEQLFFFRFFFRLDISPATETSTHESKNEWTAKEGETKRTRSKWSFRLIAKHEHRYDREMRWRQRKTVKKAKRYISFMTRIAIVFFFASCVINEMTNQRTIIFFFRSTKNVKLLINLWTRKTVSLFLCSFADSFRYAMLTADDIIIAVMEWVFAHRSAIFSREREKEKKKLLKVDTTRTTRKVVLIWFLFFFVSKRFSDDVNADKLYATQQTTVEYERQKKSFGWLIKLKSQRGREYCECMRFFCI